MSDNLITSITKNANKGLKYWLSRIAIVVAFALVLIYRPNLFNLDENVKLQKTDENAQIISGKALNLEGEYKAVFLTNDQVYFGKLQDYNENFIKLTNIYYLRLAEELHNQKFDETKNPLPSQLVLIKLGKELHGPRDEMLISKDQILFVEGLQSSSMVVSTISDYENKK